MRKETRDKLFGGDFDAYQELAFAETDAGYVSWLLIPSFGRVVILHEYLNPESGFEVYVPTPNNLDATRKALMLTDE